MELKHHRTLINHLKAKNIKDFWNRWHMTLSFWFRDCIYMRSLFYMSRKKLLKSQFAMSNMAFFLNFFIMGIWHGLEVYYIVYGLYHAALFIGYGYYERWRKTSTTLAKWIYYSIEYYHYFPFCNIWILNFLR